LARPATGEVAGGQIHNRDVGIRRVCCLLRLRCCLGEGVLVRATRPARALALEDEEYMPAGGPKTGPESIVHRAMQATQRNSMSVHLFPWASGDGRIIGKERAIDTAEEVAMP
jgi:hypothetical protein